MGEVINIGTPVRIRELEIVDRGITISISEDTPVVLLQRIVDGILKLPSPATYTAPIFRFLYPVPIEEGGGVGRGEFRREKAWRGANDPVIFFWRFVRFEEKE